MIDFKTFLERRERNPLRKRELEDSDRVDNKEWVDDYIEGKSKEEIEQIKADHLSPTIGEEHKLLFNRSGVRVYTDKYVTVDHDEGSEVYRLMLEHVNILLGRKNTTHNDGSYSFRDILPNRKPKVVITDFARNPIASGVREAAGFYYRKIIFLDQNSLDHKHLLIHEYAHFLAFSIPARSKKILEQAYKNLLDEYYIMINKKKTRRKALEGDRNEGERVKVAKYLGLPSSYAATNFDEWFAEFISHWRSFKQKPQTKEWYRMKQLVKKVLFSL